MRRAEFEHVIAAAATVSGHTELVVIGSQAIFGSVPDPPEEMLRSMEADLYPRHDPAIADHIDGALGDGSQFHAHYGYYAHGVGPETAKAPSGWEDRLVRMEIPGRPDPAKGSVAWCLEPHDLVLAKCAAARDRDWEYARHALRAHLVDSQELLLRIGGMPVPDVLRDHIRMMLQQITTEMDESEGRAPRSS